MRRMGGGGNSWASVMWATKKSHLKVAAVQAISLSNLASDA